MYVQDRLLWLPQVRAVYSKIRLCGRTNPQCTNTTRTEDLLSDRIVVATAVLACYQTSRY